MVDGNRFTAYAIETTSYECINDAYMKIRLNHAEARHIVCAWNFPSTRAYESSSYCNDGDHGVGQHILQLLRVNDLSHIAVFIVRNYTGKLNDKRLQAYAQALQKVINRMPTNTINKKQQKMNIINLGEQPSNTYAGAVLHSNRPSKKGQVHRRGRGRGRGRGGRGSYRGGGGGSHTQDRRQDEDQTEVYVPPVPYINRPSNREYSQD